MQETGPDEYHKCQWIKQICLEKRKVTLANKSCELRAARLECMRKCLEAETPEQRVARLEQMSTLQQQRLEVETPERRAARLECLRQCLEAETPEQRDAMLEQMSTLQQQRLEVETPERRAARLEGCLYSLDWTTGLTFELTFELFSFFQ